MFPYNLSCIQHSIFHLTQSAVATENQPFLILCFVLITMKLIINMLDVSLFEHSKLLAWVNSKASQKTILCLP